MSEWKEDAAKRRDFRRTKGEPEVAPVKSKKNPKYCKKLKGSHEEALEPLSPRRYKFLDIWVCKGCGKHLRYEWLKNRWFKG